MAAPASEYTQLGCVSRNDNATYGSIDKEDNSAWRLLMGNWVDRSRDQLARQASSQTHSAPLVGTPPSIAACQCGLLAPKALGKAMTLPLRTVAPRTGGTEVHRLAGDGGRATGACCPIPVINASIVPSHEWPDSGAVATRATAGTLLRVRTIHKRLAKKLVAWAEAHPDDGESASEHATALAAKLLGVARDIASDRRVPLVREPGGTAVLGSWFEEHLDDPFPTPREKEQLSALSGLSEQQVSVYFVNKRQRDRRYRRRAR